jgi:hypothetical protein
MSRGSIFQVSSLAKCAAVAMLCFLVPAAAWANSCQPSTICFSNSGGTMTGSPTTGFVMGSSAITTINGVPATGASLSFTLGSLISGNMATLKVGQSVYFNPGTFTINGTFGGFTGTLFSGTFGVPGVGVQWTLQEIIGTGKNATYLYDLSGPINGTWFSGLTVTGESTQLLFSFKGGPYTGGSISLENGSTFVVVPEPASMGLMGTGLLSMGLALRRKLRQA